MGIQVGARRRQIAAFGSAAGAALAAVLIVGTITGQGGASVDQAPGNTVDPVPDAAMAAALEQWKAFPVDAAKRPLVVLSAVVGPSGFTTSAQKQKFMAGNWAAPKTLPAGPAKHAGYPVISAAAALKALRAAGGGGTAKASPLAVTDLRLGAVRTPTDRGVLKLPAWRVMFTGSTGPTWVPAVAAPARYAVPALPSASNPSASNPSAVGSKDGRTLTLTFSGAPDTPGPCGADYTVDVAESAQAVAVRIVKVARAAGGTIACAAALHSRTATVSLGAPMGDRVLLGVEPGNGAVSGPLAVVAGKV